MLDFRIETFLAVCESMNYTRAAEMLNITQPAVSQHIQYLQEEYGAKLFLYRNKRLTLTPEGTMLRNAALTMHHDAQKLRQDIRSLQSGARTIRLGATLTIGTYVIPSHLAAYLKSHPEDDVHLLVENTQILLEELSAGRLDCALVEGYFPQSEYDFLHWSLEPYVCVCGAGHTLPPGHLGLEDLLGETLLLRTPGSGSREVFLRVLEEHNLRPADFRRVIEISDLTVIQELVKADCGITFLYRRAAEPACAAGELREIPLSDFHVEHKFTFLWRKGSVFEPEFRRFFYDLCAPDF